jgi:hypothetical protein
MTKRTELHVEESKKSQDWIQIVWMKHKSKQMELNGTPIAWMKHKSTQTELKQHPHGVVLADWLGGLAGSPRAAAVVVEVVGAALLHQHRESPQ